jgi:uncharacterized protein (DUF58 family)
MLLGAALLFAVGTSVQAGWVIALAAVVLGTGIAGVLLPARFVRGVGVTRRAPAEAFQGDEVEVEYVVETRTRGVRLGVDIVDGFLSPGRVAIPPLARGDRVAVGVVRRASRRGVHERLDAVVASAAPFGVAEARRSVRADGRTVVYPAVERLGPVPFLGDVPTFERSAHAEPRRGVGPEYLGVREYRTGDSMRHVHWPSTARHGQLMVREFEREHTRRVAVVLDTSRDAGDAPTPLDRACSVAASLAFAAMGGGHGVRLVAARGGRVDALSRAARPAILRWLAQLAPFGGVEPIELFAALPEHLRGVHTAVLVLPSWRSSAGAGEALEEGLAGVGRVAAVVVHAAGFDGVGSALAMNPGEVHAFELGLATAGCDVFRLHAREEIAACLSRPLVPSA